jgi:hypothetical protein
MNTPYLVVKEVLPSGRLAWRRMLNTQFSPVPAIDIAFHQRSNLNLKPIDFPRQVIHHEPKMILSQNLVLPNLVVNLPFQKGH